MRTRAIGSKSFPPVSHSAVLRFALVLVCSWARVGEGSGLEWQPRHGFRSAPMIVATNGKTGFTRLDGFATGITFTNFLSHAATARNRILENGSGVALGDVDGDGWCDVYFCRLEGPNVLYRNLGNWRFEDITAKAGVACREQFSTGAVFADSDGDGDLDLFVNSVGGGTRLFLNDGKGQFNESMASGLLKRFCGASMALADIEGDGDLDLYVANYRTTTYKDAPPGVKAEAYLVNGKVVVTPEDRFEGLVYKGGGIGLIEKGEPDVLYINKGEGRFGPVSWTAGAFADEEGQRLANLPLDWGLAAAFRDLDDNGTPDLYVCNDFFFSRDKIWLNENGLRFRAAPRLMVRNMSMSSMAVDFADINRDGHYDFVVVDMMSRQHEFRHRQRANVLKGKIDLPVGDPEYRPETPRNTLFLSRGDGTYAEIAQLSGLEASEWSWSAAFLDVDLDGFEDLLVTNGNNHDSLDADLLKEIETPGRKATEEEHVRNLLKFPRLETANLLFRNRGDLTFVETGEEWGFNTVGISHGMALADLDNDGDLDVVVNNLHSGAGIYRNNASAARVAVRLKGKGQNVHGVGAKVKVFGGAVPQSQEMICGGRYLSCDDTMRVFAAGAVTNRIKIEVTWRNGGVSIVEDAQANRIYEIDETVAATAKPREGLSESQASSQRKDSTRASASAATAFEDVSPLLGHRHVDMSFDDFSRQPLLPRRLSQLGPGVAWFDFDGDGWDDLIIGSGRGGRLSVFRNTGQGGFTDVAEAPFAEEVLRDQTAVMGWRKGPGQTVILAGSANYEGEPSSASSVRQYDVSARKAEAIAQIEGSSIGALALSDIDGDEDLDLFVSGRARPGRYPEAVPSRLYRNDGGTLRFDPESSAQFEKIGLVSGAVFSDLEGDGFAELILACDWGPIRVFRNSAGRFREMTEALGLAQFVGWWNGVNAGDFDGDGRMDLIATNFGRNTKYQRHLRHPVRVYYGDFASQRTIALLEAYFDGALKKAVPWATLDAASPSLPFLALRFPTYRAFSTASVSEVLGDKMAMAKEWFATTLDSMVFLNRGGRFETASLPVEAQFAPAFGVAVADYDGDGSEDAFLSQNFFGADTETSRYDAGRGLWLKGNGQGTFTAVPGQENGVKVYGEQRGCAVADFDKDGRIDLVVAQNSGATKLFRNRGARPGLRIKLRGPEANSDGIGAKLRLVFGNRMGPAREIHLGAGYWSQDSAVIVMAAPEPPTHVWLQWPGGQEAKIAVPRNAQEVEIDRDGSISSK